jgi:glycosyltransferase involved in cell wall biosynthesis
VKKKIFVKGPVLSQSGYGEQSRFALRALRSREDLFEVYVQPIPWGQTGWIWEESEFRTWMDSRIAETQVLMNQKALNPDISLQVTIPNEFQRMCPVNIGYTAGMETDRVAGEWLQKGNEQVDKILVVSNHSKNTYARTSVQAQNSETQEVVDYKLETPIEVVHEHVLRLDPEPIENFDLPYDFNFLVVSQAGPRKNLSKTIEWFVEEFYDQEVGLILKTNVRSNSYLDFVNVQKQLSAVLAGYPERKCKIHLLHGDLSRSQLIWLYNNEKVKCMINLSHGEGFGLPLFEAAREGTPIITVPWSGQMDFLNFKGKDYFKAVKFELKPVDQTAVWKGVIRADAEWAYADAGSYKMSLRDVYKNYPKFKKQANELVEILNVEFSREVIEKKFVDGVLGFDSSIIEPTTQEETVLEFD